MSGRSTRSFGTACTIRTQGCRYQCAFLLGDLKVHRAERALRAALEGATGKDDEFFRYTVSKSLAQLGEADVQVLRNLFAAVSDDSFMSRHIGNIGLKALSGKNLEDFEGYHYAEGAFVRRWLRVRDWVRCHHLRREEGAAVPGGHGLLQVAQERTA